LEDIISTLTEEKEKIIVVAVNTGEDEYMDLSLLELEELALACNMEPVGSLVQNTATINKGTCLGSGKVIELSHLVKDLEADTVIFDNTLTPMQMRNLQDQLGCAVMDRTGLILEIFSRRAGTKEAKLQVESARLKYILPRLAGMRTNLGRQGGGSGSRSNKGAGEKKIELDRRVIEHRITVLRRELEEISKEKKTQRKKRANQTVRQVALVGYTNAGKSTILNSMVTLFCNDEDKTVLEKDMLFATLDTSVRRIQRKDKEDFFLSDTVGFIHKLPHGLVEAFKSTLEEVKEADLLLHVIDFSDDNYKQHVEVTKNTLAEIDAGGIPVLYVYNKTDKKPGDYNDGENSIYISAKNTEDMERLGDKINSMLYPDRKKCVFLFPYAQGAAVNHFKEQGNVNRLEYREDGVLLECTCSLQDVNTYSAFIVDK